MHTPTTHFGVIAILSFFASTTAAKYVPKDTYITPNTTADSTSTFFDKFDFFTDTDPTKGFVQYQSMDSSISAHLIGTLPSNAIYMGVDSTNKTTSGRQSVRIESKASYNKGLLIADIPHMPSSTCGSWPAFWMLGPQWPEGGEIDILENVNDAETNAVTLHTGAGCAVDGLKSPRSGSGSMASRAHQHRRDGAAADGFLGDMETPNCDVKAVDQPPNKGCSIAAPEEGLASYGTRFNTNGGGIYATEITSEHISVWFIPYSSSSTNASTSPDTATIFTTPDPKKWGKPLARFAGKGCDFDAKFRDMKIIFDTTFCGEWAGRVWESGGCAKKTGVATCEKFVGENPEAFKESWWGVSGLVWFEDDGEQ